MHFCAWFFAAVLLLCSVFFSFQDLTTAEDEERTPDLYLERLSGGAGWRVTWRLQPGEFGLFWRLFCAFFLRCFACLGFCFAHVFACAFLGLGL